jgi:hypothetical protein
MILVTMYFTLEEDDSHRNNIVHLNRCGFPLLGNLVFDGCMRRNHF